MYKNQSLVLSTGFAMFSMFFGSGNLVFPLMVGQTSEGHYFLAAIGILLTGVFVPFLGILAMMLFHGSTEHFFGRFGVRATFWISLVALSLMGPFGVLARCITVAHGAFALIFAHTSLWVFSFVGCIFIFVLSIRKNRIVSLLGTFLTPVLLASLAAIFIGALKAGHVPKPSIHTGGQAFLHGVFQGYQTMDLFAAFFFSVFVIQSLRSQHDLHLNKKSSLVVFFQSASIGASLLAVIYFFLVLMGAMYAPYLIDVAPQEMLGMVAHETLGPFAAPIVCIAVIFACLTTAIVLTSLFADFFRREIAKNRISQAGSLAVTLVIAFCVSTLNFSGIAQFLGPILEVSYPSLIVLAVLSILEKTVGWRFVKTPTLLVLGVSLIAYFLK